ncbi:negative regulator of sigma-X activity [Mesobacillus harenae]|uniref:negative regulator of sigma-X activity n=1 Tax=Mesobacillus harenae TaxID=2213203 RepID=UPI00157FE1E4|nr:negative regulator of sigma-X activity [Mesobacillus harenae]
MRKSELSDKQLEEMLRQMPKIKDQRDPRDIYQNIASKVEKKKRAVWLFPGLAASAAALLFIILAPTLLDWNFSMQESSEQNSSAYDTSENDQSANTILADTDKADSASMFEAAGQEEEITSLAEAKEANLGVTAVYEEDLNGSQVLTYAIPDPNALVTIPVSVVVPEDKTKSDFDQYKDTMDSLREEEWGLADFYPLNAELSFDPSIKTVKADLPKDHQYGIGSANEIMFFSAMEKTFENLNVEKINLYTDGNDGAIFGNFGEIKEISIKDPGNQAYFFYYLPDSSVPYLVPFTENFKTIDAAYDQMTKDHETSGLRASIPAGIKVHELSGVEGATLQITLKEGTELTENMLHSFEAMLLTAKSFGFQAVKVVGAETDTLGPFNLNEEIKLPIAPNKREIRN